MKIPLELERMMFGFIESQILFVCDKYRIFDYLSDTDIATPSAVAKDLNLSSEAMERIFIAATTIGLLDKKNGKYSINKKWKPYLTRHNSFYCGGKFTHYFKTSYKIFQYLEDALQDNIPQWHKIGSKSFQKGKLESVYQEIYKDPESTKEFLDTMWSSGYQDSQELCKKFSFMGHYKLIDLGGATGSFSVAALQENLELRAKIMDFPNIEEYVKEISTKYNLSNRLEFYSGNIFKDKFPEGDIYVMGYMLSDWPKNICVSLMEKIYKNLPSGGLIVILEKFFNEDKTGPYLTSMLNMVMLLEMYGSHRTVSEYFDWLKYTGFTDLQVIYSSGEKHMIIGKKGS